MSVSAEMPTGHDFYYRVVGPNINHVVYVRLWGDAGRHLDSIAPELAKAKCTAELSSKDEYRREKWPKQN